MKKKLLTVGPTFGAAVAAAVRALGAAGLEVPTAKGKLYVSGLVQLALLALPSVPQEALRAAVQDIARARGVHQRKLITPGKGWDVAVAGAVQALEAARVELPREPNAKKLQPGEVNLSGLVRLAVTALPLLPQDALQAAAQRGRDIERSAALAQVVEADALAGAARALGADPANPARVVDAALRAAVKGPRP